MPKKTAELRKGRRFYIAAVGTDGTRAVVWGIGRSETREAHAVAHAVMDAEHFDAKWNSNGGFTTEITEEVYTRIRAGEVSCDDLGIAYRVHDGKIEGA